MRLGSKNDKGIQLRRKIKAVGYSLWYMWRHSWRYIRNVNADYFTSQENFMPILIANYHVIEKCLAMPNFEAGHGKERVQLVCADLLTYRKLGFDCNHVQYKCAVQAILEYDAVHKKSNYALPASLQQLIDCVLSENPIKSHEQKQVNKEEFFANSDASFELFAKSRHSCRAYSSMDIPIEEISACVDLARTTPTACNRQPNKTYVVTQPELIKKIIQLQGGGRGFAENANKLLIITSKTTVFSYNEILETMKSGGMYAMNLLYALHHHKIGVCPLLWGEDIKKDKQLRKWINIPDNEEIIIVYACGYPLDTFKYVRSERNTLEESMIVV